LHVALQCAGDTAADCDAVDIDGHNNPVTLVVLGEEGRTVYEFGANASETRTEERTERNAITDATTSIEQFLAPISIDDFEPCESTVRPA
jgi:hypothetical protein